MLGSVSLVSASLDVDGTENLNERYVFYVVPLLFIGLALWIQYGMPRHRPWGLLLVASCAIMTLALPIDRLHYNSGFQSVALVPWIVLSLKGAALAAVVATFTLVCGALWLMCARDRAGRLWLLVGIWMCVVGLLTVGSNNTSARSSAGSRRPLADVGGRRGPGRRQRPGPVGRESRGRRRSRRGLLLGDGHRVLQSERRRRLSLRAETYYETFLPTVPARVGSGGVVVDREGRQVDASYVLVSCHTSVAGKVLARLPGGMLRLVAVERPLRISGRACKRHL